MRLRFWLRAFVPALFSLALAAQDIRQVSEPKIPPACSTLDAAIAARGGVLEEADELRPDTQRIQKAIDACSAGKSVVLQAHRNRTVFLSGPLTLKSGVTLVVGANTVLAASRDPRAFDITPGSCGIVGAKGHGCRGLISVMKTTGSGIMGDGAIDGRGGASLMAQKVTWWDLAHEAKVTDQQQSVPWMIMVRESKEFTLYRITLRNSPGFHVSVNQTDGFTVWGVKIMTPGTARNTDGIDPGSSRNVTITNCFISTGDDDVAVKSGKAGPASNISLLHNHFYTGHGMSIGSGTDGGVDHMLVDDLTIDGADNGLRIKSDRSRGGLVENVVYRNVCIRNTRNPILLTPMYTTFQGNLLPPYRNISFENVHVLTPGTYTFLGLDTEHKLQLTWTTYSPRVLIGRRSLPGTRRLGLVRVQATCSRTEQESRSPNRPTLIQARHSLAMRVSLCFLHCREPRKWPAPSPRKTRLCMSRPTEPVTFTRYRERWMWPRQPELSC